MSKHVNNICNLSQIDGETVKFITTDNFGFTQTLKNTGDIILLRDKDRHDIYVAGEHIAGGFGFDSDENLNTLTTIANSYYSYIQYIGSKIDVIKDIVDSKEDPVQPVNPDDYYIYTVGINDTSYTITTDNAGKPCFVADKELTLTDIELTPSDNCRRHVISYNTSTYIMEAGVSFTLKPTNSIYFNAQGTTSIATVDIFATSYLNGKTITGWQYTPYQISTKDFDHAVVIDDSHYPQINGQTVSERIVLSCNLEKDSVSVVINDENYNPQGIHSPVVFKSKDVVWQLPYLYGTSEITQDNFFNYPGSFVWRNDVVTDKMIDKDIEITFDNNYSYAWFACPQKWGTPTFVHKKSGLTHPWILENNVLDIIINETTHVRYNVYKSKQEYWSGNAAGTQIIKWHVS